jgi:hypothetical protein
MFGKSVERVIEVLVGTLLATHFMREKLFPVRKVGITLNVGVYLGQEESVCDRQGFAVNLLTSTDPDFTTIATSNLQSLGYAFSTNPKLWLKFWIATKHNRFSTFLCAFHQFLVTVSSEEKCTFPRFLKKIFPVFGNIPGQSSVLADHPVAGTGNNDTDPAQRGA